MFRWLEMASIILKHANQTFYIFLDYARKSAICATGWKFVVADQKIAGRNKAHCIFIQNKAES
jgi:hypothetical protein